MAVFKAHERVDNPARALHAVTDWIVAATLQ
jgi:hypothetical protein